jgi:hypothetical protein
MKHCRRISSAQGMSLARIRIGVYSSLIADLPKQNKCFGWIYQWTLTFPPRSQWCASFKVTIKVSLNWRKSPKNWYNWHPED